MFCQQLLAVAAATTLAVPLACAGPSAVADPALSVWISGVLSHNPELQAAQAGVDAAAAHVRAAGQPLFNPELEFDFESAEADTATGGINQTIDWADKQGARGAVADSERAVVLAELNGRRQALAADLLRALAESQSAAAVLRISEHQAQLMNRFAHLAEQRRLAGELGQVELDLAHLAAADAELGLSDAREQLIRAQQALTALGASNPADWPALSGKLPELPAGRLDTDALLAGLPSLQAARAQVMAAQASVQLSVREKRPDPTLGVRAGMEDSEPLAGITLSVPLYVRNNYRAEVDVANAELIRAQRAADSLQQQARAGLVAAAQIYRNAQRAWDSWQSSGAQRLSQRTELLDRLWQAGELGTTDYLVQLQQALATEASATEQYGRLWRAWADWLEASGQIVLWLELEGETP